LVARPNPFAVQRTSVVITVETLVGFSAGEMVEEDLREAASAFGLT
jgi:hypothetical protein